MVVIVALVGAAFAVDADGDGYVLPADCDDRDAAVHPRAPERTGDGRDQDCDGAETCFLDSDEDGARDPRPIFGGYPTIASLDTDCVDPGEAGPTADDCALHSAAISPLADEVVGNGIDNDCDGAETCFHDNDGDGFGGDAAWLVTSIVDLDCDDPTESSILGDCDDADWSVHPGVEEIVGDLFDQDCDGGLTCFLDADGDGARTELVVGSADLDCTDPLEGWEWEALDCDDADPLRTPGAVEMCDGIDNDCDGAADPIDLLGAVPAVAGALNTWEVVGGPASSTARLVTSKSLGETALVGCPSDPYDLANARRTGSGTTDTNGDASLSGAVSAGSAGRTIYAQVAFPGTCERSCVVETAF